MLTACRFPQQPRPALSASPRAVLLARVRAPVIALWIVGAMLVAPLVYAEAPKSAAQVLFQEGRDALARGDYPTACDKFQQSDELDPAPGTRLNLGECELQRGRVATAYFLFLAVERQLSESDVRIPVARSKRESAETRLPKLVIQLPNNAPADTRIIIRGRLYLTPELAEPIILDPGLTEVTVGAPGIDPRTMAVQVEEGKLTTLSVPPETFGASPPMRQTQPAKEQRVPSSNRTSPSWHLERTARASSKKTGVAFLGFGITGTVLGGVAGILTLEAKHTNRAHCNSVSQTCDSEGRDAASRGLLFGTLTTAGFAASAVGISIGTYLLVRKEPKKTSARVQLRSLGSGAGVFVTQAF